MSQSIVDLIRVYKLITGIVLQYLEHHEGIVFRTRNRDKS